MSKNSPSLIIPGLGGLYDSLKPLSYPVLRFVSGIILSAHGAQKILGWWGGNIEGTAGFFNKIGLVPGLPLAYLVGCVELFGGLAIAIGLLTRPAAVLAAIVLYVAAFKVHSGAFFWGGRGLEYPLLWAVLMTYIAIRGGGKMSADNSIGKEF